MLHIASVSLQETEIHCQTKCILLYFFGKIAAEKATLAEWNVPLKNGGDYLLQKYDYFSFLRKDFPLKVIFSA